MGTDSRYGFEVRQVPAFAAFCRHCNCNILEEAGGDYACYTETDGVHAEMDMNDLSFCPKCEYPLNDNAVELMRDNMEVEDDIMPLDALFALWERYRKWLRAERAMKARDRIYGVRMAKATSNGAQEFSKENT